MKGEVKASEVVVEADATLENLQKAVGNLKTYKLSKVVTVADKTFEVLHIDFEGLTGYDMEEIAGLPGCYKGDAGQAEFSKTYLSHVVARAAGITIHEFRRFPISDASILTMMAQAFLLKEASRVTGTS